jgi:hypothetical protein
MDSVVIFNFFEKSVTYNLWPQEPGFLVEHISKRCAINARPVAVQGKTGISGHTSTSSIKPGVGAARQDRLNPRVKDCILEIKPVSGLKKPVQLPIKRGSEGVLPSVNTL